MQAIVVKAPGGAEQLQVEEVTQPIPGPNELLIKVQTAALNRADILQREGKYPPPPGASELLGLEVAGIVEACGDSCGQWAPGDRVMGLLPGGGYAEYALLDEQLAMPIPQGLSFEQAAAIPEVFLTAFQCVKWLGDIKHGQNVLIHAGASGVGTAAIQLAQAFGADIIAVTVGSDLKQEKCLDLGATLALNYKSDVTWADALVEKIGKDNIHLVLDFVGAPYFKDNLKVLAPEGKLVLIAAMGGFKVESFNLLPFLLKRVQVMGTTLRSRSLAYKTKLTQELAEFVLPRFRDERLKPVVDTVFPWEEVQAAHAHMEANLNIGKIILKVGAE